jgi:hypothetical protein
LALAHSVSVGTVINEQVTFHDLPPTIVEVVPQFRGYRYIVVRDQIVIVEPQSKKIVYVMSRSGGSGKRTSLSISGEKRAMVKKTLVSGPKITKTIKVEEDMVVPQDIELSTVYETVVSDLPELRSYRHFVVEDQVVIVEPETRRVIEIIR